MICRKISGSEQTSELRYNFKSIIKNQEESTPSWSLLKDKFKKTSQQY